MRFPPLPSWSLLLVAAWPAMASAQTLSPDVIGAINAAARVQVRLVGGGHGILYAPQADAVTLRYRRGEVLNRGGSVVRLPPPLPVAQVAEIRTPVGSRTGRGAAIGAGVGASLGLLLFIGASSEGGGFGPAGGEAALSVLGLSAVGAGVGALIGSAATRWESVYRR